MPMKRGEAPKPTESEIWMRQMGEETLGDEPERLTPIIGYEIRVRILVKKPSDWDYVTETMDSCRQYGSAEIIKRTVFAE